MLRDADQQAAEAAGEMQKRILAQPPEPAPTWFSNRTWTPAERAVEFIGARFNMPGEDARLRLHGLLADGLVPARYTNFLLDQPALEYPEEAFWQSAALVGDGQHVVEASTLLGKRFPFGVNVPRMLAALGVKTDEAEQHVGDPTPAQPRRPKTGRPSLVDPALAHMEQRHAADLLLPTSNCSPRLTKSSPA